MKFRRSVSYEEGLREDLQDPEEAAAYLNVVIEEGDVEDIRLAFQDVADAWSLPSSPTDDADLVAEFLKLCQTIGLRLAVKNPVAA